MQWGIEADPGRLTASFPVWDSAEEAERRATHPVMERPGIPLPRVLVRDAPGQPWRVVVRGEACQHEWLDRPESDTYECLICGEER